MAVDNFDLSPEVTIIGAGPCGCAFAADLASRGKSVMLYGHPDHRGAIPMIEKNGGWLKASGEISGTFQVQTTSDFDVAARHSAFLVSTVPSYGQETILQALSPCDLQHHTLIVNVGNFFYLASRQKINPKNVLETDISPYATRITGDTVFVKGVKKSLAIWAEPPTSETEASYYNQADVDFLHQEVESIFSQRLVWCKNLLEVGLNNINPVVHCPAALMNAGWIEATRGDFFFYAQGMSPAVSRVTEKIDGERLAIARAYGLDLVSITDYMNQNYRHDQEFSDYHDFARGSVIHNKTKSAPTSMNHRYLLEDILFAMVPWYELGLKAGLSSPTIHSLIELASVVSGFDYLTHGRSLRAAGFEELSMEQILLALGGPADNAAAAVLAPLSDSRINGRVNGVDSHVALPKTQVVA
ncbi:hypothetical protein P168DRAFT_338134 [Aspergillus campestris IBT 28561]|uniref:NAD/NADP octopine/nopaline dehydrogenase n=1 Tax=Aspergillus campestris (strain IBT 28561) TaxID=1392248 RepID=A0A2I1DBF2_ASPC2|nr:uncharacterized protein P168DRAFT_338134 [Aspergillus campestris IBT 28561]PKY07212.1 hypothetical protein P168DRAFT_338134 [Aspergillus campestris IBT 28561]